MRLAARFFATMMVVALVMVPALYANDATSSTAKAKPAPVVRSSTNRKTRSSTPPPAGKIHNFADREDDTPKVEWFLGYSYWGATPKTSTNRMVDLHGGSTSIAYNFNSYFGLVADVGGFDDNRLTFTDPTTSHTAKSRGTAYTYMFGPRFSYRRYERFTPFAEALFGGAYATPVTISGCSGDPSCTPLGAENEFAAIIGVGVDVKITHRIAWRLAEADFLLTHFKDPFSAGGQEEGWQDNVRLSTGIVFRFGGSAPPPPPPPNRSPIASCSLDRSTVFGGSNDTIAIGTSASDPDGDPLTYSWTATGGSVDGNGPQVRWQSAGVMPGNYTVTVTVSDGRGGSTTCSVNPSVAVRPNRPPTVTLTSNRDTVFIGERVLFTAVGADPDNDPLTYTWRTTCGQLSGSDTTDTLDTTGLPADVCTVTVRVDDGRGGSADASKGLTVQAPPPPPQASKLSGCDFKPAASPRVDNVCKRILDDVGLRLQNEPKGTVVIIGYSDPKPAARAAKLAADRGANAGKYLTDKGVDASRITTRTGVGQAGATDNSRIDIIWVPEGATY